MTDEQAAYYNDASVDMAVSFADVGILALIFLGIPLCVAWAFAFLNGDYD